MYHRVGVRAGVHVGGRFIRAVKGMIANGGAHGVLTSATQKIRFLPWFSIAGFTIVVVFCIAFGAVLSHFMTGEILDHDAKLTSRFVTSVERVQSREARLGPDVTLGQLLDKRTDFAALGISPQVAASVRTQYFDHLRLLPDVRLATVFAPDRTMIWSTNRALIGKISQENDELEEAISEHRMVSNNSFSGEHHKDEQQFVSEPGMPFVESYIPLLDSKGQVAAIVEIYKEPLGLMHAVNRGKTLIWSCIAFGAIFLYIAPFWIFRRADGALNEQQRRLLEAETLCVIGEMSAAVAHGIRNPLASIRSSAELALDADPDAARKNAVDIISQVDRLGKWVRELLVFSRPVTGEVQEIDAVSLIDECLPNFMSQLQQHRIALDFTRPLEDVPRVVGNRALANQALASVICNAIEAMPNGGSLRLEVQVAAGMPGCVDIVVSDSGCGMSPTQVDLVFKPFYTTKRNGIGLGLAQVKRIMERFGGNVVMQSRLDEGTQVSLCFRVA